MSDEKQHGSITLYSDVRSSQVRWLWYPFIAIGKITLLQGDPGDGKSTMMMNLISDISNGSTFPDGKGPGRPQRIIYQCSEDGVSDTIKPRLEASGANCNNIGFINEETQGNLTIDDERLRQAIIDFRPTLVVIDPIQAYLGNESDLQLAGRARKLIQRLSLWASTYDCAVVLIGHLNKKEGSKGLYRGLGSIDLVATARSVLQVERDRRDPNIRIVRQIKNSLAPSNSLIRFEIRPETGFKWLDMADSHEQKDIFEDVPISKKKDRAAILLKELLSESDMEADDIYTALEKEQISRRTACSIKQFLGIRSYRKDSRWFWTMRPKDLQEA